MILIFLHSLKLFKNSLYACQIGKSCEEGLDLATCTCVYYALGNQQASLSTVMALAYTSPVWATLLSVAFGLESFSWMRLAGVVVTVAGMGIVVYAK